MRWWTGWLVASCAVLALSSCDDYYGGGLTPVIPSHMLKVQGSGQGSGTVVAPDVTPELACTIVAGALSGACAGGYPSNTTIPLVATPNVGSTFAGWSGTGCTGTGQCVVDMTQERTVTATFAPINPR